MCQTCCDNHFAAIHELLAQNNQLLQELHSKDSLLEQLLQLFLTSSVSPESNSGSSSSAATNESQEIEEFKYIHIEVTDDKERAQVHKMMCNIVRLPRLQQVCEELYKLMKKRKVLCTINPEAMLKELRRLGLPGEDQEGFSQKNFQHYYRAPKID